MRQLNFKLFDEYIDDIVEFWEFLQVNEAPIQNIEDIKQALECLIIITEYREEYLSELNQAFLKSYFGIIYCVYFNDSSCKRIILSLNRNYIRKSASKLFFKSIIVNKHMLILWVHRFFTLCENLNPEFSSQIFIKWGTKYHLFVSNELILREAIAILFMSFDEFFELFISLFIHNFHIIFLLPNEGLNRNLFQF